VELYSFFVLSLFSYFLNQSLVTEGLKFFLRLPATRQNDAISIQSWPVSDVYLLERIHIYLRYDNTEDNSFSLSFYVQRVSRKIITL
jgi:hypothetical protein